MEFRKLRELMVSSQLVPRGIRDPGVLEAMATVKRHLFVNERSIKKSYDDCALPSLEGQTISQPYMVAIMTELLALTGNEKVLEIGTGSGYQTAILSMLSREVYTVETVESLSQRAEEVLGSTGFNNVNYKVGDGTAGWEQNAPYDRIIVTASAPSIPQPLIKQLAPDGIIVIPLGTRGMQRLLRGIIKSGELETSHHTQCVFVPLVGEYGWES